MDESKGKLDAYMRSNLQSDGGISLALFGASRSGKTSLMVWLLNTVFDYDYVGEKKDKKPVLILQTTSPNAQPLGGVEDKDLITFPLGYDPGFLQKARKHNRRWGNLTPFVFIFDDVLGLRHKQHISSLVLTDRNKNISSIVSTQYYKSLGPDIRTSVNFVFLLRAFAEGYEQTIDLYLGGWLPRSWDKTKKILFFRTFTEKGQGRCFVINNLKNEVIFVDHTRSIFPISALVKQFDQNYLKIYQHYESDI